MDDLIAFLRARLDDDDEIANRWLYEYGDQRSWRVVGGRRLTYGNGCSEDVVAIDVDSKTLYNERIYVTRDLDDCTEHIARHDPARVLAEVDAKREIIDRFAELHHNPARHTDAALHLCWNVLRHVVLVLAVPYAEHPDYDGEWRP